MVSTVTPSPQLKQVLKDLELRGGRNKAAFQDICNENEGFYGVAGSTVRRTYQHLRDRLVNRKTAEQYKDIVEKCGVVPAAATISEAMEELKKAMEKATIAPTPTAAPAPTPAPAKDEQKTPTRKVKVADPNLTPPTSPGPALFKKMMQSPSDVSITSFTATTLTMDDLDPNVGWSPTNPHIVPVPRGNTILPHGFVSMFAGASAGVGAHERDIYFLSKVLGGDISKWKCTIPTDFPDYVGRCLLVESPGLDYLHMDAKVLVDSLEATMKLNNCRVLPAIASAFKCGVSKLKSHFNRATTKHKQYYLFVYPPGIVFDNTAVSGADAKDQVKANGIKIDTKVGIFQQKNHTNLVCFWAIATEASEDARMEEFEGSLSSDVYGF